MRMLAEFFPEFSDKLDEMDTLYADQRSIDEKTYQFICFALSIKGRSKPCVLKHFKGALEAGATVKELAYILALVMREAAGADDCWTHDVIGDWKEIIAGNIACDTRYDDGVIATSNVGRFQPNRWGLYDMHGNVQEWVQDACEWRTIWTAGTGTLTRTYVDGITDPLETKGKHRVVRGGGWFQNSKYQRCAYRTNYKPVARRNSLGFRIVREQ